MTEEKWAVPQHVVQIAVSVGVDEVGPVAALGKEWVRSDGANGGVDAARHDRQRAAVERPGPVVGYTAGSTAGRK